MVGSATHHFFARLMTRSVTSGFATRNRESISNRSIPTPMTSGCQPCVVHENRWSISTPHYLPNFRIPSVTQQAGDYHGLVVLPAVTHTADVEANHSSPSHLSPAPCGQKNRNTEIRLDNLKKRVPVSSFPLLLFHFLSLSLCSLFRD